MTYADGTTLNGSTGFTASGLQHGETIGSVTLTSNAPLSTSGNAIAGSWTVTAANASGGTFSASNYSISYATGTLTVSPATLTVSGVTANTKTYDGTTTATLSTGSATLAGVVSEDVVALDGSSYTATFASANAGTGLQRLRQRPGPHRPRRRQLHPDPAQRPHAPTSRRPHSPSSASAPTTRPTTAPRRRR